MQVSPAQVRDRGVVLVTVRPGGCVDLPQGQPEAEIVVTEGGVGGNGAQAKAPDGYLIECM